MRYKAILFDMDGTLVPMDINSFTEGYFGLVGKFLTARGFDAEMVLKGIVAGSKAMFENDGTQTNSDVFWQVFEHRSGMKRVQLEPAMRTFYATEFNFAEALTGKNPDAGDAIKYARRCAPIVALATNPLFPIEAQETRLSWVGLKKDDFDLITTYDSDHHTKPALGYYTSVCERLGVLPRECLMIGNDEGEDMYPANELGMDCYLVTDSVIRNRKHPWNGKNGTFAELIKYLKNEVECNGL